MTQLKPSIVSPPDSRLFSASTAAIFASVSTALIWAQFRSFDLLDGGYYFLTYEHPADNPDTNTYFNILVRPIWLFCNRNIVALRIFSLLTASVASWLFSKAVKRLIPGTSTHNDLFLPLWLASMAGISWVPVALTYNSLATIFILLAFALLQEFIGGPDRLAKLFRLHRVRTVAIAGLVCGIFLVKPPAALAFLGCCYVLFLFRVDSRFVQRRVLIGIKYAAILTGVCLLILHSIASTRTFTGSYSIAGIQFSGGWIRFTAGRYISELRGFMRSLASDLIWTIAPTMLLVYTVIVGDSASRKTRRLTSILLGFLIAGLVGATLQRGLWRCSFSVAVSGEAARFYLLMWCSLLPIWIACRFRQARRSSHKELLPFVWIVVMLTLPLIGSFGSTNTPYVSALHEAVIWTAGLLLLADQVARLTFALWFRRSVGAVICLVVIGHIFTGQFLHPYMNQPSLWNQTELVAVGNPPTALKLDHNAATFLNDVREKLRAAGYRPGDDVFGFFNLPGVIFMVGATEPGAPWYFGTWYSHNDTDGGKIRRVSQARKNNAWIITQSDVTMFRPQFLECGIDFPNNYTEVGKTINPTTGLEIGIWKPRSRI